MLKKLNKTAKQEEQRAVAKIPEKIAAKEPIRVVNIDGITDKLPWWASDKLPLFITFCKLLSI